MLTVFWPRRLRTRAATGGLKLAHASSAQLVRLQAEIGRPDRGRLPDRGLRAERAGGARRRARPVSRVVPARFAGVGRRPRRLRPTRPGAAPPSTRGSAGDEAALFEILEWRATAALFGPTPVPAAIIALPGDPRAGAKQPGRGGRGPSSAMAALHAMAGDFDEADRLVRGRRRGPRRARWSAFGHSATGSPGRHAGRPTGGGRSERLRTGYVRGCGRWARRHCLPRTAAMLAQALYAQARHEEAAELSAG